MKRFLRTFFSESYFHLNSADRYYHSRAAVKAAPASISAASTSTAQPQLHNSHRLSEEAEAGTSGIWSPPQGPTELPSFLRGVSVFFYNLPASERKRLARYLITYPFVLSVRYLLLHSSCSMFKSLKTNYSYTFCKFLTGEMLVSFVSICCLSLAAALMMGMRRRS